MRIQPIQTNQPIFKMRYNQKVYDNIVSKRVIDKIELDNGNRLVISTNYLFDKPTDKLMTLYDKLGNWVKSKLRYYKGRRVIQEMRSHNEK